MGHIRSRGKNVNVRRLLRRFPCTSVSETADISFRTSSCPLPATATIRRSTMPARTATTGPVRSTRATRTTRTTSTSIRATSTGTTTIGTTGNLSALSAPPQHLPLCYFFVLMHLTYQQLRSDLNQAYLDARRHKRSRSYQLRFESDLEHNLQQLCDELWRRTYHPRPSACFIISDPKRREVFAAEFRDRIVHHLYYNYVHQMLERTFIQDSYSCVPGRGTHYGIRRLEHHIRQESQNYSEPCYVLKMDIQGYFMHIRREKLLEITLRQLHRMARHRISKYRSETWADRVDMDMVDYLTRQIILLNPIEDCKMKGSSEDWATLPHSKSLFYSPEGCGLPIGNLTSQLFSNVYMNELDQYMKRQLRCRHYGRYVDDFFVVSADRDFLHRLIPQVRAFLLSELGLTLHPGKLRIDSVRQGVEFLGAYLKPWRKLVSSTSLRRMRRKLSALLTPHSSSCAVPHLVSSLTSFWGIMIHYRSYYLRINFFSMALKSC